MWRPINAIARLKEVPKGTFAPLQGVFTIFAGVDYQIVAPSYFGVCCQNLLDKMGVWKIRDD